MNALLDDDVGIAVGEKFTKKAFAKQHDIKAVEKKKEAHKKPKISEKVIVPNNFNCKKNYLI